MINFFLYFIIANNCKKYKFTFKKKIYVYIIIIFDNWIYSSNFAYNVNKFIYTKYKPQFYFLYCVQLKEL